MAQKRKSQAVTPQLASESALKRYTEALSRGKTFIPERGFELDPQNASHDWILNTIFSRGWWEFCQPRQAAVIPIVREFYANVPEHQNFRVRVRGKVVRFDAEAINKFFKIPTPREDGYSTFVNAEITPELASAMWSAVSNQPENWTITQGGQRSLQRRELKVAAKAWFYFAVSTMLPTTNHQICRQDKVRLLYAICMDMPINVGELLCQAIIQTSVSSSTGFWFPCMITMLCRKAKVFMEDHEEQIPAGQTMTARYLELLQARGPRGDPIVQAMYLRDFPEEDAPEDPPEFSIEEQMQRLHMGQERQGAYMEHGFHQLESMLRLQGAAAGMDMASYPPIPTWAGFQDTGSSTSQPRGYNDQHGDGAEDEGHGGDY